MELSPMLTNIVDRISANPPLTRGMRLTQERLTDFSCEAEMQLTGIALDPLAREAADRMLDDAWSDGDTTLLQSVGTPNELIIGSGFHAAVYAAARVRAGFSKPLVIERSARVGGVFAVSDRPTFRLNSPNRAGEPGLSGDPGVSLNYLPGAPIQPANISTSEYQTNADMAFVIRLALAQYANVVPSRTVRSVGVVDVDGLTPVSFEEGGTVLPTRVIDARGIGDPKDQDLANGDTIMTFPQFMRTMAKPWPLKGIRRAAVIGGGDSSRCVVEALLGIGPQPLMAAAALDTVERVDWYAANVPTTCDEWRTQERGRYLAIGGALRSGRRLGVIPVGDAEAIAIPDRAIVADRTYNLVVLATGDRENRISGLVPRNYQPYVVGGQPVAMMDVVRNVYRVGPHARLAFTDRERADGVADIRNNIVAMFRLVNKTAALAGMLPS